MLPVSLVHPVHCSRVLYWIQGRPRRSTRLPVSLAHPVGQQKLTVSSLSYSPKQNVRSASTFSVPDVCPKIELVWIQLLHCSSRSERNPTRRKPSFLLQPGLKVASFEKRKCLRITASSASWKGVKSWGIFHFSTAEKMAKSLRSQWSFGNNSAWTLTSISFWRVRRRLTISSVKYRSAGSQIKKCTQ